MTLTSGPIAPRYSVQRALRLLEIIAGHPDGLSEQELARRSGLPPRQLARLLAMLYDEGYAHQLRDGAYAAGEALLQLGSTGHDRERIREERLQLMLDDLRDSLNATVYLGRYTDGELDVPHHSTRPDLPMVNEWVDFRSAGHATAVGKCLLSQLDHDGRREHLARHRTARLTSHTITDPRVLLASLERQPASMPVLDLQEYAVGTLCAAVPLTAGSTVGCLALSLPVDEAHRLRRTAERLNERAAPALLSLAL